MEERQESEIFFVNSERIEQALSPRSVIEYEGTYDIIEETQIGSGQHFTVSSEDIEMELKFKELENGYVYEQVNNVGPFDEMRTSITYKETEKGHTKVTITSHFTFGLPLAIVTDRLAGWNRQVELRRLLMRLSEEIAE